LKNWWIDWQGKPKYSEKTCPSAALSTTNPKCCPDAKPGRRGWKPATNRLSYGTALNYQFNLITRVLLPCSKNEFLLNLVLCVNGPASLGGEIYNPVTVSPGKIFGFIDKV
jgi:hypothetical protein